MNRDNYMYHQIHYFYFSLTLLYFLHQMGSSPLWGALGSNHLEVVSLLLENGANVNETFDVSYFEV